MLKLAFLGHQNSKINNNFFAKFGSIVRKYLQLVTIKY